MPNFDVIAPNVGSTPGLLMGLDPTYQAQQLANQQTQLQLGASQAFKDGLPVDGQGNTDWGAATNRLMQLGAYDQADKLATFGLQQGAISAAQRNATGVGQYGGAPGGAVPGLAPPASGGPAPAGSSPMPSGPVNPDVLNYIRTSAAARGINPDTAMRVSASEGLKGFDPNGNPNLGDGGSSAGPFQLHYGGVASGGNAVAGLGDDFTKATGLDARNPATWKQQVDFSLDNVTQNGWGAFHGAKALGIGNWDGISQGDKGQSSGQGASAAAPLVDPTHAAAEPVRSVARAAASPSAIPDAARQPTAEGAPVGDSAVMAARQRLAAAQDADPSSLTPAQQQQLTADTGTVDAYTTQHAQPTASLAPTSAAMPSDVSDALARLQNRQGNAADAALWGSYQRGQGQGGRSAPIGVSGTGGGDPSSARALLTQQAERPSDGIPRPVSFGSSQDAPPGSVHPFGPGSTAITGSTGPSLRPPSAVGGQLPTPGGAMPPAAGVPGAGSPAPLPISLNGGVPAAPPPSAGGIGLGQAAPAPAPMPTQPTAPPPVSAAPATSTQMLDPSFGGLVPPAWLKAGHTAGDWVNYARQQAAINGGLPFGAGKANEEGWSKIADGLSSAIDKSNVYTPVMPWPSSTRRTGNVGKSNCACRPTRICRGSTLRGSRLRQPRPGRNRARPLTPSCRRSRCRAVRPSIDRLQTSPRAVGRSRISRPSSHKSRKPSASSTATCRGSSSSDRWRKSGSA